MVKIKGEQGKRYKYIIKNLQTELKLKTAKEAQRWLFEALGELIDYNEIKLNIIKNQ